MADPEASPAGDSRDARRRGTLQAIVDSLLPGEDEKSSPDPAPSGTHAGVVEELWRVVHSYLPENQRSDFLRFLDAFDNRWLNLLLNGSPTRFRALDPAAREKRLQEWAGSQLALKRRGFQAVKRLSTFLYYARPADARGHPNWRRISYIPRSPSSGPLRSALQGLRPAVVPDVGDLSAEVCVVGSGAGGAVFASELARLGHTVAILEAGGWNSPEEFPGIEAEGFDRMYRGHGLVTSDDLSFNILAGETAGGSTTINWMTSLPPLPIARTEWERWGGFEGISGPIFEEDLAAVNRRLHVSVVPEHVNGSNEVLRRGSDRLGYSTPADYFLIPRNDLGCESRCGACQFGCPFEGKQSALVTYLADAMRAGARLYCRCRVRVVERAPTGYRVLSTLTDGESSRTVIVKARAVVVAAGALETPAILLRSGFRTGGIGHGLRLDPTTALAGEFPDRTCTWEGAMQTVAVRRFQGTDEGLHGPWIEAAPAHPGLSAQALPWDNAKEHRSIMNRLDHAASSIVLVRDLAEGQVRVDRQGRSVASYWLTRRDEQNLLRGIEETARIHVAAGAVRIRSLHSPGITAGDGENPVRPVDLESFVEEVRRVGIRPNAIGLFSAHPMGTVRAGRTEQEGPALPTGELRGAPGIWVGDASLLPTAPGVNPMISIMALALRTSREVHRSLGAPGGDR